MPNRLSWAAFAAVLLMSLAARSNSWGAPLPKPLVVAHRGFSHVAPENTMIAMRQAWQAGADAVELDVHLSADGRVVVIHDEDTSRTAGVALKVAETSASRLRELDVGSWKGPQFARERIPFLEEVLVALPEGSRAFIEIKSGPQTIAPIRQIIERSGKATQVTLIGFNLEVMSQAKRAMPNQPVFWLRSTVFDEATSKPLAHAHEWVRQAKERGLDGLDVHFRGLDQSFAQAVRAAGMELHAWTVNNPAEADRLATMGVDSITTDRPDLVLEVIGRGNGSSSPAH
ncbi:MAG: glycerophosphodiester phosphodiesterase [Candidatus Sumerlaeaceae bacterium]|nr:glycerophosphodiester phosphodiesterase [Candidatus Sumerlaeaceae bacterium]